MACRRSQVRSLSGPPFFILPRCKAGFFMHRLTQARGSKSRGTVQSAPAHSPCPKTPSRRATKNIRTPRTRPTLRRPTTLRSAPQYGNKPAPPSASTRCQPANILRPAQGISYNRDMPFYNGIKWEAHKQKACIR